MLLASLTHMDSVLCTKKDVWKSKNANIMLNISLLGEVGRMRLIDADALQELFNECSSNLLSRPELTKDTEHMVRAFLMVTEMINDAPTIIR